MKTSDIISAVGVLFITLPIWLFLLYAILVAINPDRLIWFLYWVYVPATILIGFLSQIVAKLEEE